MQPQPQNQDTPAGWLFRNGPLLITLVIRSWAASVEVFLRRDFGSHYLGTQAALVIPLCVFWASLWEGHDARPLVIFLLCYLVFCVHARLGVWRRYLKGQHEHSHYNGWPRLMKLFPRSSERTIKLYVEPGLVFGIAFLIGNHNPPLCFFLFIAGGATFALNADIDTHERWRARQMNDAAIEQQLVAEQFREVRGESW